MDYCLGDGGRHGERCGPRHPMSMSTVTARSTRSVWISTATACIDDAMADLDGDGLAEHMVRDATASGVTSPTTDRAPGRWASTGPGWAHSLLGECGGSASTGSEHTGGPVVDVDGDGQSRRAVNSTSTATGWPTARCVRRCRLRRHRRRRPVGHQARGLRRRRQGRRRHRAVMTAARGAHLPPSNPRCRSLR